MKIVSTKEDKEKKRKEREPQLVTIGGSRLITFPSKTDQTLGRNLDAYCKYHDANEHSMDSCQELKSEIENLFWGGDLDQFVDVKALRRESNDEIW